jgi:mevalonate kinase
MGVIASAPAKVILFGEHFVVYGAPAIVLAIDKRAYVSAEKRSEHRIRFRSATLKLEGYYENGVFKVQQGDAREARLRFEPAKMAVERVLEKYGKATGLNIEINSTLPVGAGLGSSAAVVVSTTAAVGALLDTKISKEEIFRISLEAERIVHGTPSGIDPAISTFGGVLLYQLDTGFKPLDVKEDIPLVIGDTGVERSTKRQVEKLREVVNKYPRITEPIMRAASEIVILATEALKENDLETLGELMNINQALLVGMDVSDESLEWLINAGRKAGALGAKLTGAGGGGCMVALARNEKLERVMEAIQRVGGKPFKAKKTDEGVRVEQT